MVLTDIQIKKHQKMISQMTELVAKQSFCCSIMADSTRIKILITIKQFGQVRVSDIADILQITVSAVSHQLKKLENFGAVVRIKKGQEVNYSLNKKNHVVQCLYNFQKQRI